MAGVRNAAVNNKKNSSLTCADAKSYLFQASSKSNASLYVYNFTACRDRYWHKMSSNAQLRCWFTL